MAMDLMFILNLYLINLILNIYFISINFMLNYYPTTTIILLLIN